MLKTLTGPPGSRRHAASLRLVSILHSVATAEDVHPEDKAKLLKAATALTSAQLDAYDVRTPSHRPMEARR
jgi:hypothetical protein